MSLEVTPARLAQRHASCCEAMMIGHAAADQGENDFRPWRQTRSGHSRHPGARGDSSRHHMFKALYFTPSTGVQQQQSPRGSTDALAGVM